MSYLEWKALTFLFIYLILLLLLNFFLSLLNYLYNYFLSWTKKDLQLQLFEGYNFYSGARTSKCGIRERCHLDCASIEKRGKELV
jgi:hypothetical protein